MIFCIVLLCLVAGLSSQQTTHGLSEAIHSFSGAVYLEMKKFNPEDSNYLFSPLSLHSTLALLALGATPKSETEKELKTALGVVADNKQLTDQYSQALRNYNTTPTFLYVNHLWIDDSFKLEDQYVQDTAKLLAGTTKLDFRYQTKESEDTINLWVEEATNNRIKDLVSDLQKETTMVITNVIYLKEKWTRRFSTLPDPVEFHLIDGKTKMVPMMYREDTDFSYGKFRVQEDAPENEIITIPYTDSDLEFQIILPNPEYGVKSLDNLDRELGIAGTLNISLFQLAKDSVRKDSPVHLTMPKFKTEAKVDCIPLLKELGVQRCFSEDDSELGGISSNKELKLVASQVRQQVFLDLDEAGVEAAAATFGNTNHLTSNSHTPPEAVRVVVDRPFMFLIYDKVNNIPVFLGKIVDPVQQ